MIPRVLFALLPVAVLAACSEAPRTEDAYAHWPAEGTYFPYTYTPETDLESYEDVRWETETWVPTEDLDLAGQYLLKSSYHRPGAPEESLDHFAAMRSAVPPLGAAPDLSLVGDVMWVGDNWSTYAEGAAQMLDGTLRVGNLETPTSPNHPHVLADLGTYTFNAPPEMLDGLPLDLLQLNNNHSLDVGEDGLDDTLAEVEARGIAHTGVDDHALLDVGGRTVAFLSYTWGINQRDVVPERELFILPFGHLDEVLDLAPLEQHIERARIDGADAVVVLAHWGFEYEYYPDPHFLVLGRRMVSAGADLVVGHGPHVVQPPEVCAVNQPDVVPGIGTCSVRDDRGEPREAAILYSLGNFGTPQATLPCQVGIAASVTLEPLALGWAGVAFVEDGWGPQLFPLADQLDDEEMAAEALRLDEHLGTGWKR